MADVNAEINISINSSQAVSQLRSLQAQVTAFNQSLVSGNVAAARAQKDLLNNLTTQINATKAFTTSMVDVETSAGRLGRAIDKNRLSLREYFRYGIAASGAMGKGMREHAEIMELAESRVKRLQTQYIGLTQAHNGYTRSMAIRPTNLFNADAAIGIQRQQLFNKLLHDGSTSLVNWGKNTQWAGRQLMVGFTVPLTIFSGIAGKIFMDLEKQIVQFKRVYGDLQTPAGEKSAMVQEIQDLGKEFTKYGIAVSDTVGLAAKAAATGATGADLLAATTEATRLATLGQIDYQQALDATISLQTAFRISSEDLADTTNFLNAVENQTVTSLDDITQAIPLVAPVIKGLGGDVKDLAIFMTAMREGGISANEGANALKSGLASLINPTKGAREQLEKVGINIDSILSKNKGDLRGLVTEFGQALGSLSKFERQQTLAKLFGKYQFARLGALFNNISKEGSQAARVMDLTALSAEELGQIAEGELGQLEEAVGTKFTAAVEKLKLAIAPIGEAFLKIATPIIDFATMIAEKFNELPDGMKSFITWGTAIAGVLVPTLIMVVGLLGNFAGNMLKILAVFRGGMGKLRGVGSAFSYLAEEELDAMAASASLEGQTNTLTSALNVQRTAVNRLTSAYGNYVKGAAAAATNIPQGFRGRSAVKMATGGFVAGTGNEDSEPALLMPGEFVVNKKAAQRYGSILSAMNNGTLKGYANGSSTTLTGTTPIHHPPGGLYGPGNNTDSFGISRSFIGTQDFIDELRMSMAAGAADIEGLRVSTSGIVSTMQSYEETISQYVPRIVEELKVSVDDATHISEAWSNSADRLEPILREMEATGGEAQKAAQYVRDAYLSPTREASEARGEKRVWTTYFNPESGDQTNLIPGRVGGTSMHQRLLDKLRGSRGAGGTDDRGRPWQYAHQAKARFQGAVGSLTMGGGGRRRLSAGMLPDSIRTTLANESEQIAREVSNGTLIAMRDAFDSHSDAEMTAKIGDDVDGGLASGIARSAKEPIAAAEKLSVDVGTSLRTGMSEQLDLFEAETGPIQGELFNTQGYRGSRKLTGAPATPKGMSDYGVSMAPLEIRRNLMLSLDKAAKGAEDTAKESGLVSKGLKNFGGALKNGSMKLTGSMFALDGLVFGLSMMENGIGEFAQKIMPAVFGLQSLQMILPMLMNPIGGAIAAITAVGAGLWLLNKTSSDLRENAKNLSKAMYGAAANIKETGDFFGNKTFSDRADSIGAGKDSVNEEDLTKAQEYMTTEAGQKLIEDLKSVLDNLGSEDAAKALQNNLQRLILSGAVTPQQAKALASELGKEIGNTQVGIDARLHITEMVGADGKITSFDERMKIVADIIGDTSSLSDAMERAGFLWDGAAWYTQVFTIIKGEGTVDLFAEGAAAEQISKLQVIQTEMDRLNVLLDNGSISLATYQENMAQLITKREELSYSKAVEEAAFLYGDDWAAAEQAQDRLAQGFVDALMSSVSGLGKESADKFIGDFNTEMSLINTTNGNLEKRKINILDPEDVRTQLSELDKAIEQKKDYLANELQDSTDNSANWTNEQLAQNAKRVKSYQADIAAMEEAKRKLQELQDASLTLGTKLESGIISLPTVQKLLDNDVKPVDIALMLDAQYGSPEAEAVVMAALNMAEDGGELDFVMNVVTKMDQSQLETSGSGILNTLNLPSEVSLPIVMKWGEMSPEVAARSVQNMTNMANASLAEIDTVKEVKLYMKDEFSPVVDRFKWDWKMIAGLDPLQKYVYFNYITTYITRYQTANGGTVSPNAADNTEGMKPGQQPWGTVPPGGEDDPDPDPVVPDPPSGGSSGGGNKEKTWLEEKIEEFKANSRLYGTANKWLSKLKKDRGVFFGRIQQLRSGTRVVGKGKVVGGFARVPEQLIEEIGAGPEGLKRMQQLLGLSKKKFNQFIKQWKDDVAKRTVDTLRSGITEANRAKRASGILQGKGFSKEIADELSQDTDIVETLLAKTKEGGKALYEFIQLLKQSQALKAEEIKDPLEELEDAWSNYSNAVEAAFDLERIKQEELFAAKQYVTAEGEKNVAQIEELIDKNEDLIQIQQDIVDSKQEEIDDYQRTNDLIQQRIDNLRREDEMRNRVAELLERDLQAIQDQETKIRDAYQKRIDALDKVAQINQRIINQQKNQISLAQALTEGDVYAAAQVAEDMRRENAEQANEYSKQSLQDAMENQIENLSAANGMRRREIEAQIAGIKEAIYQNSLLIRIEEDKIYQNNLEVRRLSNEIYDIEEDKIEPLKKQNEQYERILDRHKKELEYAVAHLFAADMTTEEWNKAKLSQEKLVASIVGSIDKINAYRDAWNAAADAARRAQQAAAAIGVASSTPASTPAAGTISWAPNGVGYANDPSAPYYSTSPTGAPIFNYGARRFAGGKIKKFAAGSIVGDGRRDSVPAMLTPGEYVIRRSMVEKYGTPFFDSLNMGSFQMPRFRSPERVGMPNTSSAPRQNNSASVYNNSYSVNVNASGTNASPDQIANVVISKIRAIEQMSVRG